MNKQSLDELPNKLPVPDGQERMATQAERDDVNETIEGPDPSSVKNGGEQADGK